MIVNVLLIGLALILSYIGSRRRLTRIQFTFVTLFFLCGAAMVLRPEWSMDIAHFLNVGRGADLLLYFSVLSGVLIAANFFFRFKQQERITIELVRRLAILTPTHPSREKL